MKREKTIVRAAVFNHGRALQYADKSLLQDRDFICELIQERAASEQSLRPFVDQSGFSATLLADRQIALALLAADADYWRLIGRELQNSEEFQWQAFCVNPQVAAAFKSEIAGTYQTYLESGVGKIMPPAIAAVAALMKETGRSNTGFADLMIRMLPTLPGPDTAVPS